MNITPFYQMAIRVICKFQSWLGIFTYSLWCSHKKIIEIHLGYRKYMSLKDYLENLYANHRTGVIIKIKYDNITANAI